MTATLAYSNTREATHTQTHTHAYTRLICPTADKACWGGFVAPVIAHT